MPCSPDYNCWGDIMEKLLRLRVEHYDWTVNPRVDYDQIGHLQFSGKFVGDKDADILADVRLMLDRMETRYKLYHKECADARKARAQLEEACTTVREPARESDYEKVWHDVYPSNPASVLAALAEYDRKELQRYIPMWAIVDQHRDDVGFIVDSENRNADGVWWVGSEVMAGKRRTKANVEWLKAIADGEMREYCAWTNNDAVYLRVEVADATPDADAYSTAPCWVGYEDMYPTAWTEDNAGVSGGPWYGDNAVSNMVSDLVDVYPLTPAQVLWLNMHLDAYPADSGDWVYLLHAEITQ